MASPPALKPRVASRQLLLSQLFDGAGDKLASTGGDGTAPRWSP
jgi:hypothetical protein